MRKGGGEFDDCGAVKPMQQRRQQQGLHRPLGPSCAPRWHLHRQAGTVGGRGPLHGWLRRGKAGRPVSGMGVTLSTFGVLSGGVGCGCSCRLVQAWRLPHELRVVVVAVVSLRAPNGWPCIHPDAGAPAQSDMAARRRAACTHIAASASPSLCCGGARLGLLCQREARGIGLQDAGQGVALAGQGHLQ